MEDTLCLTKMRVLGAFLGEGGTPCGRRHLVIAPLQPCAPPSPPLLHGALTHHNSAAYITRVFNLGLPQPPHHHHASITLSFPHKITAFHNWKHYSTFVSPWLPTFLTAMQRRASVASQRLGQCWTSVGGIEGCKSRWSEWLGFFFFLSFDLLLFQGYCMLLNYLIQNCCTYQNISKWTETRKLFCRKLLVSVFHACVMQPTWPTTKKVSPF